MLKDWVQHLACIFILAKMRPTYKYPTISPFGKFLGKQFSKYQELE